MNRVLRILRWLGRVRRLPLRVAVPSLLVVVGGVGFGVYRVADAYKYMEENPNFCRACHTMEAAWNKWYTSEHRSLSCHSCHETNVIQGAEQLIKFSLNQPERVSKHAVVTDKSCKSCHESDNPRWRQVAVEAGHRVHAEEQNIACTKCHALSVHRFRAPKQICGACHEGVAITVAGMAGQHCSTCHSYLAQNSSLLPQRQTCLACHKAQRVQKVTWPEDAPMKVDCRQCHQPHQKAEPTVNCVSCHKDIKEQGLHQKPVHQAASCTTCHQPHQWVVKNRDSCLTCHADRVQHNPGPTCDSCHKFKGGP